MQRRLNRGMEHLRIIGYLQYVYYYSFNLQLVNSEIRGIECLHVVCPSKIQLIFKRLNMFENLKLIKNSSTRAR